MKSGFASKPVAYVSFWVAGRISNWLQNDQPTGLQTSLTTEDGFYTLTPAAVATNSVLRNVVGNVWEWREPASELGRTHAEGVELLEEVFARVNSMPFHGVLSRRVAIDDFDVLGASGDGVPVAVRARDHPRARMGRAATTLRGRGGPPPGGNNASITVYCCWVSAPPRRMATRSPATEMTLMSSCSDLSGPTVRAFGRREHPWDPVIFAT